MKIPTYLQKEVIPLRRNQVSVRNMYRKELNGKPVKCRRYPRSCMYPKLNYHKL